MPSLGSDGWAHRKWSWSVSCSGTRRCASGSSADAEPPQEEGEEEEDDVAVVVG
jgi:hypothetical protein